MVILQTKQAKIYLSYLVRHHLDFFQVFHFVSVQITSKHILMLPRLISVRSRKKKTSACSFSVLRSKPTMTTTTFKARPTFSFWCPKKNVPELFFGGWLWTRFGFGFGAAAAATALNYSFAKNKKLVKICKKYKFLQICIYFKGRICFWRRNSWVPFDDESAFEALGKF